MNSPAVINALLASAVGVSGLAYAVTAFVSDKDADLQVGCVCVVDTQLCDREIADNIAGNERHSWTLTVHVLANVPADLDSACYRKRDVTGFGDGLCCTVPNDTALTIKNLFRGTVQ